MPLARLGQPFLIRTCVLHTSVVPQVGPEVAPQPARDHGRLTCLSPLSCRARLRSCV